jgi:hemerythrin-like domain-containing protein
MKTRPAVERLVQEHDNITQVLVLLDSELASVAFAEDADDELAMLALEYLMEFVDGFHHLKEDLAIEVGARRVPALQDAIAELQDQHVRIHDGGAALRAALERALFDEPVRRRDIAQIGYAYTAELRRNMELEEQSIFPQLAEALDDEDWARIESDVGGRPDPLFGEQVHGKYERLFHELARRSGAEGASPTP